ncbi:hypothetical protein LTR97_001900 [Elasticomyces elasticus]|uniref:Uncharacterized protein n=1 Tax=Elasticomyces elasticus TaxID=574655 RepID=A0AAN7WDI4_9PEZI|nr:hypothetical protein LTR97_001900 [Elasticomyces elasticus]
MENDKAFFQAVLVIMDMKIPDPTRDTHRFCGSFLHGMKASNPRFVELPAMTALGIPMAMTTADCSHKGIELMNLRIAYMMIDSDQQGSTFGQLPQMDDVPVGGVLLARRDGRHVQTLQVVAVVDFLRDVARQMADFVDQQEGGGEKVGESIVERPTINPAAFVKAFKTMKEKAVADRDIRWAGIECPVLLEED